MGIRTNYRYTVYASYLGAVSQAVVNNFVPLLFLVFRSSFGISLEQLAFIATLNFGTQLVVDLLASKFADRLGYRLCITTAHFFCAAGLTGLAFLPSLMGSNGYAGVLICVFIYAAGGGLIEVIMSPIVEACPAENKSAAMSLLHSFYCWGQVAVVLLSTLFFGVFGIDSWQLLAVIWALVPFLNGLLFCFVPICQLCENTEKLSYRGLFKNKLFYLMIIMMVCAGACELSVSQWASAFAESALGVSKAVGDLAGPCGFAVLMGLSRVIYAKYASRINLKRALLYSAVLCLLGYATIVFSPYPVISFVGCAISGFSVGLMWPGTYSVAAKSIRGGGTAMFALLALSGDFGCTIGPTIVGSVSTAASDNLKTGFMAIMIFPIILILACIVLLCKKKKNK